MGIIYVFNKKNSWFSKKIVTDKKQLNISTWHGTPLKRLGKYQKIYSDSSSTFYTSSDFLTVNSEYLKETLGDSYYLNNIKLYGSPRNDILFDKNKKEKIKKKLGLPMDKKLVLFAPTFRENLYESGERQLSSIDFNKLLNTLKQKFGEDWAFIARVHNEVLNKVNIDSYGGLVINGNKHDDMAEYLVASDVLITDYSASMFDYLYTEKPCFLLTLDKENYENNERGFYIKMKDLPFSYALSVDELYRNIDSFNETNYKQQISKFLNDIGSVEDGKCSERIANIICEYYYNNRIASDNE